MANLRSRPSWAQHEARPATSFGDLDGPRPSNAGGSVNQPAGARHPFPAETGKERGITYSAASSEVASAGSPDNVAISASVRPEAFLRRWLW
jgi:hypothetical protein